MTKIFTAQAVASVLAAVVTVTLLASVGNVADHQYSGAVVAQAASTSTLPTQQVVIVGKRIARA